MYPSDALQIVEGSLFDDDSSISNLRAPVEKGSSNETPVRSTSGVWRVTKVIAPTFA